MKLMYTHTSTDLTTKFQLSNSLSLSLHTSSLTPSHHVLLKQNGWQWKRGLEGRYIPRKVCTAFVSGCQTSFLQPPTLLRKERSLPFTSAHRHQYPVQIYHHHHDNIYFCIQLTTTVRYRYAFKHVEHLASKNRDTVLQPPTGTDYKNVHLSGLHYVCLWTNRALEHARDKTFWPKCAMP